MNLNFINEKIYKLLKSVHGSQIPWVFHLFSCLKSPFIPIPVLCKETKSPQLSVICNFFSFVFG